MGGITPESTVTVVYNNGSGVFDSTLDYPASDANPRSIFSLVNEENV
jgi:hypothetical protein